MEQSLSSCLRLRCGTLAGCLRLRIGCRWTIRNDTFEKRSSGWFGGGGSRRMLLPSCECKSTCCSVYGLSGSIAGGESSAERWFTMKSSSCRDHDLSVRGWSGKNVFFKVWTGGSSRRVAGWMGRIRGSNQTGCKSCVLETSHALGWWSTGVVIGKRARLLRLSLFHLNLTTRNTPS